MHEGFQAAWLGVAPALRRLNDSRKAVATPYIDEAEEDEHDNDDATVMMVMRTKLVIMVVCMIKMRTRMLMRIVRQG